MKLVESEYEVAEDEEPEVEEPTSPPRPEHRRVSVSLLFTLFVLVATVTAVYLLVPERHHALMEATIEAHGKDHIEFKYEKPNAEQLEAWGDGYIGKSVPWPAPAEGVEVVGVAPMEVLNRRAVMIRYLIDGERVTLLVQRPRDAVPRSHHRSVDGQLCVSWRHKQFTFTAVGPKNTAERWRGYFGAPSE